MKSRKPSNTVQHDTYPNDGFDLGSTWDAPAATQSAQENDQEGPPVWDETDWEAALDQASQGPSDEQHSEQVTDPSEAYFEAGVRPSSGREDTVSYAGPRAGGIAARASSGGANASIAYLDGLNSEQRRAVETLDGPVLVLAGAGTGKTRVLTTRIAHILGTGRARPGQILAVTFTNKAAREMRERIEGMVGGVVEGMPWLGTFHSIGVKILRRHAELIGRKSDFTILDTADQLRLIKQVIQAEGLDEKRWPARQFASALDNWKNRGWTPKDVPEGEARAYANGRGRKLYELYQERLSVLNAADFGD